MGVHAGASVRAWRLRQVPMGMETDGEIRRQNDGDRWGDAGHDWAGSAGT